MYRYENLKITPVGAKNYRAANDCQAFGFHGINLDATSETRGLCHTTGQHAMRWRTVICIMYIFYVFSVTWRGHLLGPSAGLSAEGTYRKL